MFLRISSKSLIMISKLAYELAYPLNPKKNSTAPYFTSSLAPLEL